MISTIKKKKHLPLFFSSLSATSALLLRRQGNRHCGSDFKLRFRSCQMSKNFNNTLRILGFKQTYKYKTGKVHTNKQNAK